MQRPKSEKRPSRDGDTDADGLPLYYDTSIAAHRKRNVSNKCVHIIPIVVLLCFFILWWFSHPVDLEVKDGRFTVVPQPQVEKPLSLNETRVDFASLAAATPPYATISHIQTTENQTAAEPARGTN